MIPVSRRLQLLKVVAQFLKDNLPGDCSNIKPLVNQVNVQNQVYAMRMLASNRLDMLITVDEAHYVIYVLKTVFEAALDEGTH